MTAETEQAQTGEEGADNARQSVLLRPFRPQSLYAVQSKTDRLTDLAEQCLQGANECLGGAIGCNEKQADIAKASSRVAGGVGEKTPRRVSQQGQRGSVYGSIGMGIPSYRRQSFDD